MVGLVDSAGNQVNTYAYEPYGEFSSAPVEGVVQPYKFHGGYFDSVEGFYKMGARYYEPGTGRFTQPEPAWTNPMFNTMGGRNLLVGRSYGTGATVGQETAPLQGGYYRPGSEYNWYSYAGSDPVNESDPTGYQYGPSEKFIIGQLAFWAGFGFTCIGAFFVLGGAATFNVGAIVFGGALVWGGSYLMLAGNEMQGGAPNPMGPPAPRFGPIPIPKIPRLW